MSSFSLAPRSLLDLRALRAEETVDPSALLRELSGGGGGCPAPPPPPPPEPPEETAAALADPYGLLGPGAAGREPGGPGGGGLWASGIEAAFLADFSAGGGSATESGDGKAREGPPRPAQSKRRRPGRPAAGRGPADDGGEESRPELAAGLLAAPGDLCPECVRELVVQEMSYECPSCGLVFEAADICDVLPVSRPEGPGAGALRGRLRVVGPEARWYQPDLDRTNPGASAEAQKKLTYQELLRYNREFESRGGDPFPLDVLDDVAINYHIVQQESVKRSKLKRTILAALVFHTCISRGFTRTRADAAELLQLESHGISRGDGFLRSIDEDRGLGIDMNCDRLRPHIESAFAYLGLEGDSSAPLREAVAAIVTIAEQKDIGYSSTLRSKVIATTFEILRRSGSSYPLNAISAKCRIRRHTIRCFLNELRAYHSHFAGEYRRHGLDSSLAGIEAEKKGPRSRGPPSR